MEGVPPSFMDDDVNQLDLQAPVDNFNMSELPSSFNQSSMLCNYQAGQKTLVDNDVINYSIQQTMTAMGGLDGTSSSWINQNGPNWAQTPSRQEEAAAAARIQVSKITSSNSLHRDSCGELNLESTGFKANYSSINLGVHTLQHLSKCPHATISLETNKSASKPIFQKFEVALQIQC